MSPAVKKTVIIGVVMMLGGPIIGVAGTALGMIGAFDTLGDAGPANPAELSSNIGSVLASTLIGSLVGLLGAGVLVAALIIHFSVRSQKPRANLL
ncbi:MAG: MotA/TolQ/ExbB proton channel family [Rariglobus sp.]|jgi:biopolymer transport protein ExbB/TolQ|nr:MotA/TolQ/ExbB proton channel family [Rariglobus sp.]